MKDFMLKSDIEIIKYLSSLTLVEFNMLYCKLTTNELNEILNNPYLKELDNKIFNSLILRTKTNLISPILNNEEIYDKLMKLPIRSNNKNVLEIIMDSDVEKLKIIIKNNNIDKYSNTIKKFLMNLNDEKFKFIISLFDYDKTNLLYSKYKKEILQKFNNDEKQLEEFKTLKLNPLMLLKLNNYKELLIYVKFKLLVNVENDLNENNITFDNGLIIPINIFDSINISQVNKLIKILKEDYKASDIVALDLSLKLYYVFTFDNAKKILENKFTNMTDSAILRIIDFNFKEERREYRSKNPEHFYCFSLVNKIVNKLATNKILDVETSEVKNLCLEEENLSQLVEQLENNHKNSIVNGIADKKKLEDLVSGTLTKIIKEREQKLKEIFSKNESERIKNKCNCSKKLDLRDLNNLFGNVGLYEIINKYKKEDIKNIINLLLGNCKGNNNCLFRIIINEEALGLNTLTSEIINKYKLIENMTNNKKYNFSSNSILDLIDIMKIHYEISLQPNERDIFLSTLTKIKSSKEFCTKTDQEILKSTLDLHKERKNKIWSSIPQVKDSYNNIQYEVAPFDAEYLLSAGIDSKNCLKISAAGEDLFRYCLTSPHAVLIYLKDGSDTYICPVVRSGNAIHCNGIDPVMKEERKDIIIEALKDCFEKIMSKNYRNAKEKPRNHEDNIEIATITNLHLDNYLDDKFEQYVLERPIPIDKPECYSDFNKAEIKTYILTKSKTYEKNYYYIPKDKYYEQRNKVYQYYITEGLDKERLNLMVNSIFYSSIDNERISDKEKAKLKRSYQEKNVADYLYVVGNKDWVLTVDNQYKLSGTIIGHDRRALDEYKAASKKALDIIYNIKDGELENGINR